ncbi:MAG: hypothetical protein H7245_01830 [Candidatus Saccharibacteria bacterium]|nr:hypothetical protein [Pseudorhodobacter sp.]
MELSGQIRTLCPPDLLVTIMRDPVTLAELLPKGSVMQLLTNGTYSFSVYKTVGPLKLTLPGTLQLTPDAQGHDQTLTARAAHLIGGKVDLVLALHITSDGRITEVSYKGELTATGLAGRVLQEQGARANVSLKAALTRLKHRAEDKWRRLPAKSRA